MAKCPACGKTHAKKSMALACESRYALRQVERHWDVVLNAEDEGWWEELRRLQDEVERSLDAEAAYHGIPPAYRRARARLHEAEAKLEASKAALLEAARDVVESEKALEKERKRFTLVPKPNDVRDWDALGPAVLRRIYGTDEVAPLTVY